MPRKPCYWTRKLEIDLVNFVRQKEFIWKPVGNTNHQIQQKYKAYAEFASMLGHGFTARSVRDRWVNIRSTFHHNLRRVAKSKLKANSITDVYVPCWPLWKPLQFLRETSKKDDPKSSQNFEIITTTDQDLKPSSIVKEELQSDFDEFDMLEIRQRGQRTNRPRCKTKFVFTQDKKRDVKCKRLLDDLIKAMKPMTDVTQNSKSIVQTYWFFGKHVTERLNSMKAVDAVCASKEILKLLDEWDQHCSGDALT